MRNKVSCIIVDDEKEAREGLSLMIREDDEIELVDTCRNGIEAIDKLNEFKPQLVLLDIQMPHIDGFEVLQHIRYQPDAIIFITAYDQFALKAFEVHAVDYLLKPFSDERFYEAIAKAKEKIKYKSGSDNFKSLISHTQTASHDAVIYEKGSSATPERIVVKSDGKLHFLPPREIIWVEAYDYYIKIHVSGRILLVRETMKNMEQKLPEKYFIRIHKSSIINIQHIERLEQLSGGEQQVVMTGNESLRVSRTFKPLLAEKLNLK